MTKIELGDKVRSMVAGMEGIATCELRFINGCIQWGVTPPWDPKDGKYPRTSYIDAEELEVVERGAVRLPSQVAEVNRTNDDRRVAGGPQIHAPGAR